MESLTTVKNKSIIKTLLILIFLGHPVFSQGWYELNTGTSNDLKSVFFINENTGFFSGTGILKKTTDAGNSWTVIANDQNYGAIYFTDINTGFVLCNNTLRKTTNGGISWSDIQYPVSFTKIDIAFANNVTGYISGGSPGTILKTTNAGINWLINKRDTLYTGFDQISIISSEIVYVGSGTGFLYKTTNGGFEWTSTNLPIAMLGIFGISFMNSETGYCAGYRLASFFPVSYKGVVGKTTNGGANWFILNQNIGVRCLRVHFINEQIGFTINDINAGLFRTVDGGNTWTNQFPSVFSSMIFLDSNIGYVCGNNGKIIKTTNGGGPVGFIQMSNEVPHKYNVYQNYPNPFNPQTNIKFDIPKRSIVKISVYDILGKEISVLVNEELNPGTFEVNWDASNFPSGVYFYKIVTDGFTESKKMVLIK